MIELLIRRAIRFSFFILVVVGLVGCSKASTVIKEAKMQELNKDVQLFVNNLENKNGLYLYSPVGETQYQVAKYPNVPDGEEAKFLQSITAQILDHVLVVSIEEQGTHDYQDKRLDTIRIYKLSCVNEYGEIRIYKNGKEVSLDLVGG